MSPHAGKTPKARKQGTSAGKSKSQKGNPFTNKHPESGTQQKMQQLADESPQSRQLQSLRELADSPIQSKENKTGLPDQLKTGVEHLSGMSLQDVKVHYNSSKPGALQAHAYAQGTDIHVAPGQEKHLSHEAWHIAQQKQGRVKPTKQLKGATPINDDAGLEKEADVMGQKASGLVPQTTLPETLQAEMKTPASVDAPIQAVMTLESFKQLTDLNKKRSAISDVDNALAAYHRFVNKNTDENQEKRKQKQLQLAEKLLNEAFHYIELKAFDDPQHPRIKFVEQLYQDVLLEIKQIKGKVPSDEAIQHSFEHEPVTPETLTLALNIVKAPRSKQWIQALFERIQTPDRINLLSALCLQGDLTRILDQPFIDDIGIDTILNFPKGGALLTLHKRILNIFVNLTTDLGTMKQLMAQRYDLNLNDIKGLEVGAQTSGEGTVQQETDWDLPGLKRAYWVLSSLPDGHASSNASFKKFKRFVGSGGWFGGDESNTVAMGYTDLHAKKMDRRTKSEKFMGKGYDVFNGKNYFDASVRHEVGHAVDKAHNFSTNYCINNPNGGNWTEFTGAAEMVNDYLTIQNSPIVSHPAYKMTISVVISGFMLGMQNATETKNLVINLMTRLSEDQDVPFDPNIIHNDPVFKDLQLDNLKKPWKSSESPSFGGRTYVFSNNNKLSSYATAARARQVSNYQFRAPAEWFAEAYSAYYQPDDSELGHGSKLAARDATTFEYIRTNVDKAL